MTPKVGYSTPLLHVKDMARTLRFYQLLGFETVDTEGPRDSPNWARMHCEGGALMFLLAEEPVEPRKQAVLLYLYTSDLPALREHLLANGVAVPSIVRPEYMPSGEIRLRDPDGYAILVGHWGQTEHEAWLKRIAEKKAAAPQQ